MLPREAARRAERRGQEQSEERGRSDRPLRKVQTVFDRRDSRGNPRDQTPFENNGLYNVGGSGAYPEPNTGLFSFTGDVRDMGRMKPPSLRNVALTAPYMHDGSIATLEEVIDHYARGGRLIASGPLAGDGAASRNKSEFVTGFPMSEAAKADLLAFLDSLTDRDFVADPRFANPFAATGPP